jgi:hypothetical protein
MVPSKSNVSRREVTKWAAVAGSSLMASAAAAQDNHRDIHWFSGLTEPIVRTTLAPILARLRGADGQPPQPAQILDLKVCDPAMGSGAFLVEACRQLGDARHTS